MPSGDIHNASGACWCGLDHWFGQWQAGYNVGYREAQEDIAGAAPQPDAALARYRRRSVLEGGGESPNPTTEDAP